MSVCVCVFILISGRLLWSRVPSAIMPLLASVVSQPPTSNQYFATYVLRSWYVRPQTPFVLIYLLGCSVVHESTVYSNLTECRLEHKSPLIDLPPISSPWHPLRDENQYSLGPHVQVMLNDTPEAVESGKPGCISARRCLIARRIFICFADASCNEFCMFLRNPNNKWIYIIDIIVSSIKRVL